MVLARYNGITRTEQSITDPDSSGAEFSVEKKNPEFDPLSSCNMTHQQHISAGDATNCAVSTAGSCKICLLSAMAVCTSGSVLGRW